AFAVAARLPVHSARRQPARPSAHVRQSFHHDAPVWALARSEANIRRLGISSRSRPRDASSLARTYARKHAAAEWLGWATSDLSVRVLHLGFLPLGKSSHCAHCPWQNRGHAGRWVCLVLRATLATDIDRDRGTCSRDPR